MTESTDSPRRREDFTSELTRLAGRLRPPKDSSKGGNNDDGGSSEAGAVERILDGSGAELIDVLLSESYRGGFPHPDVLEKLSKCVDNGAERAFALTEKEQAHRHSVDERMIDAQVRLIDSQIQRTQAESTDRRIVIILTFVLLTAALAAAIVAMLNGHAVSAGVIAAGSALLTGVLALFFKSRLPKE